MTARTSAHALPPIATQRLLDNFPLEATAGGGAAGLRPVAAMLPTGTPVSVTYLPGETMQERVKATGLLGEIGMVPIPHISARRPSSHDELEAYLLALSQTGQLSRALVVGGDCKPARPFENATSIIRTGRLAAHGIRRVGIGGYPEGHPDIPAGSSWQALDENMRCHAR
jgi:methylenetetrahydrofolate reductase (NADPH)